MTPEEKRAEQELAEIAALSPEEQERRRAKFIADDDDMTIIPAEEA